MFQKGRILSKTQLGSVFKDIKDLDPRKAYKYSSTEERYDIKHKKEKEKLKKENLRRLILGFGTALSAKNKIQAIGSLAIPVHRYNFEITNWHQEKLQKLDRKTRKLLIHGQHCPKTEVDRLYGHRKQGGTGVMQLEEAYGVLIIKFVEYVDRKEDPLTKIVRTH
jgi:hypothetical protein